MLAYDVGICINAWCFEPDASLNLTKSRALLLGYNAADVSLGGRLGPDASRNGSSAGRGAVSQAGAER